MKAKQDRKGDSSAVTFCHDKGWADLSLNDIDRVGVGD